VRTGGGQWVAEIIATFGLVATILACVKHRADAVPYAVGLYITAAYWFTASTSFANPAVTMARTLTNTFSGIRPADAPLFIVCQIVGALLATWMFVWLLGLRSEKTASMGASGD
ncbi:MAG: aquaporin, partial [Geminicoccaceae bacterium]